MPSSSGVSPRHVLIAVLVLGALAALVVVLTGGDGGDGGADPAAVGQPGGPSTTAPAVAVPSDTECESRGVHLTMAMWNPTLADEMTSLDCPWPYLPELQALTGGAEDPAIPAPFEPRVYQDIFDLLTAERYGLCQVAAIPNDPASGLVFGFGLALFPGPCVDVEPSVELVVDEYATRAFRDAAANSAGGTTLVLGRWVMFASGTDTEAVARLMASIEANLGAVPVTPA